MQHVFNNKNYEYGTDLRVLSLCKYPCHMFIISGHQVYARTESRTRKPKYNKGYHSE